MSRRSIRTRREWLATCGGTTAGIAALAGCTGSNDDSENGESNENDEKTDETSGSTSSASDSGLWPMPQLSANNRMVAGNWSGPDAPLKERWTIVTGGDEKISKPVVGDGLVYATVEGPKLYAIDVQSGEIEWELLGEVPDSPPGAEFFPTTPAVSDNAVFFLTNSLTAIDPANGDKLWSVDLDSRSRGAGDIRVYEGIVYIHNNGNLYAIDVNKEDIIWRGEANSAKDISVGEDGTLYVVRRKNNNSDYEAIAFDVFEDEILWTYSPSDDIPAGMGLVVKDDIVYTHEINSVVAINGVTGNAETLAEYNDRVLKSAAPTIADGVIYMSGPTNGDAMYAAELETGEALDTWELEKVNSGPSGFRPFRTTDTLYVWRGFGSVHLDALDPKTGETQWTTHTTDHIDLLGGSIEGYGIIEDSVIFTYNSGNGSAISVLEEE